MQQTKGENTEQEGSMKDFISDSQRQKSLRNLMQFISYENKSEEEN